jgi:serine/threonine protein kinase
VNRASIGTVLLEPGSTVGGRYQIVRLLGRGGMGEVYEAVQLQLARRVALKTIRSDLAGQAELMARFRREAESAAALGHPNLVQVTDFYAPATPGEAPFLVMEMLDGATLAHLLEREPRLDPARAAFIGVQILSGLAAAHRAGIIHRDVKPANIFLQSTTAMRDLVKVLDFGVAKLALDAASVARVTTHAGQVLGTLAYMAPEQASAGASIDARTDLFGVGATLFHALSGVRPFDATEPGGARTPLARLAPWVHRDLAAIVERALERSPDARWSSAEEMAAALQPFASSAGPSMRAAAPAFETARDRGGWDPSAVGRLEAPTGGGSSAVAPTGYSSAGVTDPSVFSPRDATLLGHGARAPSGVGAHAPPGAMPYAPPIGGGLPGAPYGSAPAAAYGAPGNGAPGYGAPGYGAPGYGAPVPPGYGAPGYGAFVPGSRAMPGYGAPHGAGRPWWLIAVAVVALMAIVPYVLSFVLVRRATDPDTIATNVEREVLKQPKQPCPAPDQCTQSQKVHDLTYPLCTRKLPSLSPYKPGEMVLAGADSRIALVRTDLGGGRYVVRFLTQQADVTLADEQIAGRLCRAGRRASDGQETAP